MLERGRANVQKRRTGYSKSRKGCVTCKVRRIKCDETRPLCRNCTVTGRRCEGPSAEAFSFIQTPVHQSSATPSSDGPQQWDPERISVTTPDLRSPTRPQYLLPSVQAGGRERRAFDFFVYRIAPVFSGCLDTQFWRETIPQLCQTQPSVWHAVNAISCLFEHPQWDEVPAIDVLSRPDINSPPYQDALQSYNKAISEVKALPKEDVSTIPLALVSCVLFICIEFLQDDNIRALNLLRMGNDLWKGQEIRRRHGSKPASGPGAIGHVVAPILSRLGHLWAMTGHCQIRPALATKVETDKSTLADARAALYTHLENCHNFLNLVEVQRLKDHGDTGIDDSVRKQLWIMHRQVMGWYTSFANVLNREDVTSAEKSAASMLRVHYSVTLIRISACLRPGEMVYDEYESQFEEAVRHARLAVFATAFEASTDAENHVQPPFVFEIGVGASLYFMALKCRHPRIRRDAVQLLRKTPSKEGLWKSTPFAVVAQKIMELEEEHDDEACVGQEAEEPEDRERCYLYPRECKRVHEPRLDKQRLATGHSGWVLKFRRRCQQDEHGILQMMGFSVPVDVRVSLHGRGTLTHFRHRNAEPDSGFQLLVASELRAD